MNEKIQQPRSGMGYLILFISLYFLAIALFFIGLRQTYQDSILGPILMIISGIWLLIGFVPFFGLKVLRPQEALVLTLFGNYTGTLKGDGFFLSIRSLPPSIRRPAPDWVKAAMWKSTRSGRTYSNLAPAPSIRPKSRTSGFP